MRKIRINKPDIIKEIKKGRIFIYPTDTIYGLGCDATNNKSVDKIKQIKKRDLDKPLSIIAPSIRWIKQPCVISEDFSLDKYLPGPYTIILKKKKKNFLRNISKNETIGIRIPDNYFTKIIQQSKLPFVTTSVNLSGEKPIQEISQITEEIKKQIDIIVDIGKLNGRSSTLIIKGKKIKR